MKNLGLINHFDKFSLDITFDVNTDELEAKYIELQRKFHPDTFINKDKSEQDLAYINSISITEGYNILKNKVKRAIYILKLNGIDIENDDLQVKPDQETLITILEIKERLSSLSDENEMRQIKKDIKNQIDQILKEAEEGFKNRNYQIMAQKLIRIKYFNKIIEDIKAKR